MVSIAIWGCGDNDEGAASRSQDQPRATTGCKNAMVTNRSTNWRRESTALGRIGFFGPGRNFVEAPKRTKVPIVIEGHEPVTVSIAPADRAHTRLVVGRAGRFVEVVEVTFIPCRDRPETWWPAGFVLRNRQPVELFVRQGGEAPQPLQVGRV
jgi:hypothetical protein